jgi:hypothetical protein
MAVRRPSPAKRDLYREHKAEYAAHRNPAIMKVGPASYLVAAGKGSPGGPEFGLAIGSLFGAAYTLKFRHKAKGRDFKVSGLEGLWDVPPFGGPPKAKDLTKMSWRLMLRVPEFVTRSDVKSTNHRLAKKGKTSGEEVTLERVREGTCVQALHVGPYSEERGTVQSMIASASDSGYAIMGPLHEIYLSDPRRVPPARLRTILRFSVRKTRHGS